MATYVHNNTTLPVRVIAFLVKDDGSIKLLLTLSRTPVPARALLDVTLSKDVHQRALVPLAHEGRRISVDNRAPVSCKWTKTPRQGHRVLVITGITN